jgi:hypothetical protein
MRGDSLRKPCAPVSHVTPFLAEPHAVTYVVGPLSAHAIVGDGRGLFEGNAYVMRDPQQIESWAAR